MVEERNETVAKGINFLLDMAANMGKMAVNNVFEVETADDRTKEVSKAEIKKSFRKQLIKMVLDFFGDEEDEQKPEDKQGGEPCG